MGGQSEVLCLLNGKSNPKRQKINTSKCLFVPLVGKN